MICKYFLIILVLCLSQIVLGFNSNQQISEIQILKLKDRYRINETITFDIKNETPNDFYCTICIEKKMNNNWKEEVPDISMYHIRKSTKIWEIKRFSIKTINWNPQKTINIYKANTLGTLRIKIKYQYNIDYLSDKKKQLVYISKIFYIDSIE